jgi:hypothetical protein
VSPETELILQLFKALLIVILGAVAWILINAGTAFIWFSVYRWMMKQ